jgi:CDP-diacylglycerol--serine O-phosphatidyltransferase
MFILPNLFTVSSIFCGFFAAVTAASVATGDVDEKLYRACIAVLFAMIFDSVDGRVARLTRTQSAFGVQMDSLADVISFGVAPALIAWHWTLSQFDTWGMFTCFIYCACGTIRLARFNVMAADNSGPSSYFIGLPIPAAAGLLVAVIIATINTKTRLTPNDLWVPLLMVGLGLLMVSNVRFRTFKATKMSLKVFAVILIVFAALIIVAISVGPASAIVGLMLSYLAAGLIEGLWKLVTGDNDNDSDDGDFDEVEIENLDPLLEDGEEEFID